MKNLILTFIAMLGLASCTTHQQQRLLAATEAAALAALEYRARGASGELAASGGIIAGLAAYKTPAEGRTAITEEATASK